MIKRLQKYRDCEAALRNRDLKQALYDAGKVVMDGVLLTLHGEEHSKRREIEIRVFRRNFFKHYEKDVFPVTLKQTLEPFIENGESDLIELGYRLTVNLTADFAGIDRPLRTKQETEDLVRITKKLSEGATMVHSTRDPEELSTEVKQALSDLDANFFSASLERRENLIRQVEEESAEADVLPRDVLTVILRGRDELQIDREQQLREIAFYLQAGSHSTANSVVHAIDEILKWAGDDEARWKRLESPAFIQRCVHESLRLHPASPEAWRRPTHDTHVQGAGDISAEDRVELDLFSANRDSSIFGADADRFNPDREIPVGVMPSGLAFGIGLHTCLGRELDGGVLAKQGADPEKLHYGIVPLVVIELLGRGVRRAPDDAALVDPATSRPNYKYYPVTFSEVE
ncbi:cytochrome P450 [Pacificimonas sp. ICDLI1SI03]